MTPVSLEFHGSRRPPGHSVTEAAHAQTLALLTESGSAFTSSLYCDLQLGDPVEEEHIIGNAPLPRLRRGVPVGSAQVFVNIEAGNPTGS